MEENNDRICTRNFCIPNLIGIISLIVALLIGLPSLYYQIQESENSDPDAKNKIICPNGDIYYGKLTKDKLKTGEGVLKYYNGDKYEGNFKDDMKHGQGIYYYKNGDKYEGG